MEILTGFERERDVAIAAAQEAVAAIMEVYEEAGRRGLDVEQKEDAGGPVTEADRRGNAILVRRLAEAFPDDAILAEESEDDGARLTSDRFWCVDPLDGTKEFIKRNGEFSVMIGLVDRASGRPIFGVVAEPVARTLTIAARGCGAFLVEGDGAPQRLRVSNTAEGTELRVIVSRSHTDPQTQSVVDDLGAPGFVRCGSVGLKVDRIVEGRADVYMNFSGRTWMWDTCAPEVILIEGGGQLTDLGGERLDYSRSSALNDMAYVASNGACHDKVVAACRRALGRD